jgi:glycerophosphoryl diester phosphodiesterase
VYGLNNAKVIIIAHRGASGYLPEHTLAGKALAYGMGSDFIEQDVVLTNDNHAVVLHDIYLDAVTNVAEVFPERARQDGHFYVIDFSLSELRSLNLTERIDPQTKSAVYSGRFPVYSSRFEIATLAEEIELIQGLNKSTGKNIGLYTEIKSPTWHREHGKDISKIVLNVLREKGYSKPSDNIYIECFDPKELKRLRLELSSQLKLIQLIGENQRLESDADYEFLRTPQGLKEIASYADGIAPSLQQIVTGRDESGQFMFSSLTDDAHQIGLKVHVYTFSKDDLPPFADDFRELLVAFLNHSGVDGLFTDYPDYAVAAKYGVPRPAGK